MDAIILRPARLSDAEMVFDWRNALETRRYFFDPRPLNKTDHMTWFEQSLTLPTRCLLIAEQNKNPIGVLRYDMIDTHAETNIYLAPAYQNKGLGAPVLLAGTNWMKQHYPAIKLLRAKVLKDNIASARTFDKAGYQLTVQVYEINI